MAEQKKADVPPLGTIAREGGIVTVEIGSAHVRYEVHRTLLIHHAEYFRGALAGSWQEAEECRVVLEDVEPATFNIFLSWLYTGKIPKNNDGWLHVAEAKGISEDHESQDEAVELARLKAVVFGDRFLAFGFQEAVQKQLVKALVNMNNPAWYASVLYAYVHMSKDNPTLDLLAELQFRFWDEGTDDTRPKELTLRSELPNDFLVRVMKKFAAHRGKSKSKLQDLNSSDYHVRPRN